MPVHLCPHLRFAAAVCLILAGCGRGSLPRESLPKKIAQERPSPQSAPAAAPILVDVTVAAGIDFLHVAAGDEETYFMPRSIGSGAAFLDFDGDGLLDIYLLQNGGSKSGAVNRLFQQKADHRFRDVTARSGLDLAGFAMGVAVGDVNRDGRVDVLLSEYGRARLLLNETKNELPIFRDVTADCGLEDSAWGTSCCLLDYDRDGWLDIVIVNYVNYDPSRWCADASSRQEFCGPDAFPGTATRLFRNATPSASDLRFEDVTLSSGLMSQPGPGLGVLAADFDGDRWPDIFVANDGSPNHLWINQHDGTFVESALTRGLASNSMGKTEADMGVAVGDVDADGMFDVFVTHLSIETHTLWTQGPRGVFTDRTPLSGLTSAQWRGTGFGTALADLDNDGDLDLLVANGRVTRASSPPVDVIPGLDEFWRPYAERNQLMLNEGKGRFLDASLQNPEFSRLAAVSRGLACADWDNDGDLDVLVTRAAGPAALYENVGSHGHWLTVRAVSAANIDAYGAEVYVQLGKRQLMRWINPGYSYLCSNDPRAHFGLGKATKFDAIHVIWPDGQEETFPGGPADRQIELRRGDGG